MNAEFLTALHKLPDSIQVFFEQEFPKNSFKASFTAEQWLRLQSVSELDDTQLKLSLLPLAASYSVAPLSNFYVGAIVEALSGNIYFGANMEFHNVGIANTVHAEQSAITHAWSRGEKGIRNVTINYSPCGHCRQFMNELSNAETLVVQLPDHKPQTLHQFLPDSFGPKDLDQPEGLMDASTLKVNYNSGSALIRQAVESAAKSYAPYTHSHSGVALKVTSGDIFHGMYAENAAFNPSLPAIQVALIQLNMAGEKITNIQEACLAEVKGSTISYLAECQALLEQINPDISFEYVVVTAEVSRKTQGACA
ncbi:cytidine deaminase [Thaumasiovibrio subtropicus]|uniref:cytidine deaminase n=1 Tax=Thaumasiovibrio subtropicus TaxID=1891207 RepID=UPI000B35F528|nr:cytidine deaminase [Thaumasiovibrio subtropicus]